MMAPIGAIKVKGLLKTTKPMQILLSLFMIMISFKMMSRRVDRLLCKSEVRLSIAVLDCQASTSEHRKP